MGDYWEIMSMGWFKADASIPNEFTVGTAGWWNTEVGGVAAAELIFITAAVHHQHMALGGRAA